MTNREIQEDNQLRERAWDAEVKAWEAKRARAWARLEGIPRRKPFMAQIHIGASIFAPIVWEMRVILTSNKHSWPIIKPVDGNGKTVRCVLPNGQGKRQFSISQLVDII